MDQHDDFDSVSWKHDPDSDVSRPTTASTDAAEPSETRRDSNGKRRMSSAQEEPQAGPLADAVDLAGIGDGVLECRVDSPLKENDGTKDAYISYLVTTHVCFLLCIYCRGVEVQLLPRPPDLYISSSGP
jgi:sorting nexin-4